MPRPITVTEEVVLEAPSVGVRCAHARAQRSYQQIVRWELLAIFPTRQLGGTTSIRLSWPEDQATWSRVPVRGRTRRLRGGTGHCASRDKRHRRSRASCRSLARAAAVSRCSNRRPIAAGRRGGHAGRALCGQVVLVPLRPIMIGNPARGFLRRRASEDGRREPPARSRDFAGTHRNRRLPAEHPERSAASSARRRSRGRVRSNNPGLRTCG